jgi:putative colanic acid biosynthesis UDP-glucose lipid carrier transferase
MENAGLRFFSFFAIDRPRSEDDDVSVMADQGRGSRLSGRRPRHYSAYRDPLHAVATHPVKRLIDIVVAGFALLLFLPLLLMVMLVIRLETPGQAIFRQRRTGYRGQVFTILKFRTMTVTEDCQAVRQATKNDARVTEVGALLRKLSIDELPQLWNVLKGDMSIVGPRPHALAHDEYYGALIPTYAARFRARPGLTGYAQVNGFRGEIRDTRCMSDRVAADNSYIEAWSPALDMAILLRTIPLIFKDPRAY